MLNHYFPPLRTICEYLIALLILVEFVDVSTRFKSFCAFSFTHDAILQYFVMSFVFFSRINMVYMVSAYFYKSKIETT
jgi:hypothetical protein